MTSRSYNRMHGVWPDRMMWSKSSKHTYYKDPDMIKVTGKREKLHPL